MNMQLGGANRDAEKVLGGKVKKEIIKETHGVPCVHQKLNSTIPAVLHKQFKAHCLEKDLEMGEALTDLVEQWLKSEGVDLKPYF